MKFHPLAELFPLIEGKSLTLWSATFGDGLHEPVLCTRARSSTVAIVTSHVSKLGLTGPFRYEDNDPVAYVVA